MINDDDIVMTNVNGSFSKESTSSDSDGKVQSYTEMVRRMEIAADTLDGYDDFDSLKIDVGTYRNDDTDSPYGIKYNEKIHADGDVILRHQENAAKLFLKNLRGFGLLADVVGSGKTFEAGVVLSELTYRGKVGTLLIVAISEVISSWKDVIENKFGLGVSSLTVITKNDEEITVEEGGAKTSVDGNTFSWKKYIKRNGKRPVCPILVDLDVFKMLGESSSFASDCLFDMIIVDEAHELCNESNLKAMALLSEMIKEKKNDGSGNECYCLLLSATPHDGDLKGMFPLWYFICRRGGIPSEFTKSMSTDTGHGEEFIKERRFYRDIVCYGADNVSDFVRKKKIHDFSETGDTATAMRKELTGYLAETGRSIEEFDAAGEAGNEWAQEKMINAFMESRNAGKKVDDGIADAYRTLLSLIMIRQPRRDVTNISVGKKSVNLYFYPVREGFIGDGKIDGFNRPYPSSRADFSKVLKSFPEAYYPDFIDCNGRIYSFFERTSSPVEDYAEFLDDFLTKLDRARADVRGFKNGYAEFYKDMLRNIDDRNSTVNAYRRCTEHPRGLFNLVMPYEYTAPGSAYANKIGYVYRILASHPDERVIVFFDYDLQSNEEKRFEGGRTEKSLYDRVEEDIRKEFGGRRRIISIDASGGMSKEKQDEFNSDESHGAVLIVKGGFTHGANLQKASVIINFQVSCDPVDMEQKMGRIFRLGQDRNVVVYSLADMNELEGYALAYFTRIGLFSVDSGDATILAGCNDSTMVSVRCTECNRLRVIPAEQYNILMSELDTGITENGERQIVSAFNRATGRVYVSPMSGDGIVGTGQRELTDAELKRSGITLPDIMTNDLFCQDSSHAKGQALLMSPVNNGEFVCSKDKTHKFMRSRRENEEGYMCMGADEQIMCGTAGADSRTYFCNKLCALSHCGRHTEEFPDCEAVKAFRNREPYSVCVDKCVHSPDGGKCPDYAACRKGVGVSHCSCMPVSDSSEFSENVRQCADCVAADRGIRQGFRCAPAAHILKFNANWTGAECPICRARGKNKKDIGRLEIVPMKTFSEHIKYIWDIERTGSEQFCSILQDEAEKVGEIERILQGSEE